jgi:primosomal protein N'
MQLTRIFGLHGSGKSTKIYEYLEECVRAGKQAFLIVPEQNAVAAERLLYLITRFGILIPHLVKIGMFALF